MAKGVSFGFQGGREPGGLLRHVSLSVTRGEFLAIGGVNGAGKSTLLRLLAGEEEPSHGKIVWNAFDLRLFPPPTLARQRAYLMQQTLCSLPFTALEVVIMGAEAAGICGAEAETLAQKTMRLSHTDHLAHRTMEHLSGGEAQRVHWARVIAQLGHDWEGKCLLLDEPVSSLDLAFQHEMLALAKGVAAAGGVVVAVLHDLNLMAEYADRVVLLHKGEVAAAGAPAAVFTEALIREVYGVECTVERHPLHGGPLVLARKRDLFLAGNNGYSPL